MATLIIRGPVAGDLIYDGDVVVNPGLRTIMIAGRVAITGSLTIEQESSILVAGDMHVEGVVNTVLGSITGKKDIKCDDAVSIAGDLLCRGNLTIAGNLECDNVDCHGSIAVEGAAVCRKDIRSEQNMNVKGDLTVHGNTMCGSEFFCGGTFKHTGTFFHGRSDTGLLENKNETYGSGMDTYSGKSAGEP